MHAAKRSRPCCPPSPCFAAWSDVGLLVYKVRGCMHKGVLRTAYEASADCHKGQHSRSPHRHHQCLRTSTPKMLALPLLSSSTNPRARGLAHNKVV